jgi:hypothetical protein
MEGPTKQSGPSKKKNKKNRKGFVMMENTKTIKEIEKQELIKP